MDKRKEMGLYQSQYAVLYLGSIGVHLGGKQVLQHTSNEA